jgi:hypothetical protein
MVLKRAILNLASLAGAGMGGLASRAGWVGRTGKDAM